MVGSYCITSGSADRLRGDITFVAAQPFASGCEQYGSFRAFTSSNLFIGYPSAVHSIDGISQCPVSKQLLEWSALVQD